MVGNYTQNWQKGKEQFEKKLPTLPILWNLWKRAESEHSLPIESTQSLQSLRF
jgi:hypothetical protein